MRQRWAHLLFLHWKVDPLQLKPLLPPGLQLDTFDGSAYVGLVPFTMTGVHPWWAPPFKPLSDFHETNVRTYVHLNGADPGVWFFSLDAANSLAVRIARGMWKLPYHRAKMRLDVHMSEPCVNAHMCIEYESVRLWPGPLPAACAVQYSPVSRGMEAAPGTLEHFLIERYLLYAYRNGKLYRGRVHHEHYPIQQASVSHLSENLVAAAGIVHGDEAPLAHYASEVNVRIYPLRRVRS
jgi:uncharacterized protein YqjF (DUF2071 family)